MPRSTQIKYLLTLGVVSLGAVAVPGAIARSVPRPDLVVARGSLSASGGRLTGSFVVTNVGGAAAGRSTASLTIRTPSGMKTLARRRVGALKVSVSETIALSVEVPSGLSPRTYPIGACADSSGAIRETSERNNCRRVGTLVIMPANSGASTVPAAPMAFQTDTPLTLQSPQGNYWVDVPANYDASNRTPIELLVWLHGCGGEGAGDIYTVSPAGNRPYISIAVGGREGACWNPDTDQGLVQAAISDVETHFNIDRHEVVLGGYSSGGDLAYRLAFYHSLQFAGVLAENTSPFRDTGSTADQSLSAASWKFHVVHLAHTQDEVYSLAGVRGEIKRMTDAGFPVQLIERPGTHYDSPSPSVPGSDADLQTYLLPHLSDGWRSP